MPVDLLKFTDIDDGMVLYMAVLASPSLVHWSVSTAGFDDIEVAFGIDDCTKIIALFEQARKPADAAQTGNEPSPLRHEFKNLDGGEAATFLISPTNRGLEITLERSDEGVLCCCISFADAERVTDTLKAAIRLALSLPLDDTAQVVKS